MNSSNSRSTMFRRAFVSMAALLALAPLLVIGRPLEDDARARTYIVELQDPPLAVYDGRAVSVPLDSGQESLTATSPKARGKTKLDTDSAPSRAYLEYLGDRHQAFLMEASISLSRNLRADRTYRNAINGMAVTLTPAEAEQLLAMPMVKSLHPDRIYKLHTDAGPEWIGADFVWDGLTDHGAAQGEGVVVGVIDSGINWE
ncbi:MAG: S8 family serine peptidase, partial [Xanthomonadales bacterium]|nr:S8 family serine peptidase [Xanthomonadales bacterium]